MVSLYYDSKLIHLWERRQQESSNMTPSVDTDGTIHIGIGDGSNGKLFAINPDGNKKWITINDPTTGISE